MPAPYLYWYLAAVNVVSFLVYGGDKLSARRGGRRVPERTLLLLALFGGSLGALLAMRLSRHKTRHWYFRYGVPVFFLLHLGLLAWLALAK